MLACIRFVLESIAVGIAWPNHLAVFAMCISVLVVVVVVVVLTLTRIIKSVVVLTLTRIFKAVVAGQALVTGVEEYPREKTHTNQKWYTHIS